MNESAGQESFEESGLTAQSFKSSDQIITKIDDESILLPASQQWLPVTPDIRYLVEKHRKHRRNVEENLN